MAEADWGGSYAAHNATPDQNSEQSSGLGQAVNVVGALVSIALVVGLGVWGYKLAIRDVTGVPVVRALEGPMRVQPEDPGGTAAAHQGLAVNAVAAEGQAAGPTEEVVLAPAPVALAEDDAPARADAEVSAVLMAEAEDATAPDAAAPAPIPEAVALNENDPDPVAQALAIAEAVAESAAPLTGDTADLSMTPEAEAAMAMAASIIPADVPGVARSPRPAPRPTAIGEIVARAATQPLELGPAEDTVREVAAASIAAGTRLVQLGAYDNEDVARAEWDRLAVRFEEILVGKDRVIEKAQSGGRTFYRLRAMGFSDLSDARRFCSALMAGQAACIPVVTR